MQLLRHCRRAPGYGHTGAGGVLVPRIADAVRPGVIGQHRHAMTQPFFGGEVQALVARGSSVIQQADAGIVLPSAGFCR